VGMPRHQKKNNLGIIIFCPIIDAFNKKIQGPLSEMRIYRDFTVIKNSENLNQLRKKQKRIND
jgi:hypothetical protein